MAADLQQNIFVTLYLLFSHNYEAFAYLVGILIGIVLAFYRPSRFALFILLGFAILLFSYEYDKHIIVGLREQTLKSLITTTPHFKVARIVNLLLSDIMPIFFYVVGWGMVFTAIVSAALKIKKHEK